MNGGRMRTRMESQEVLYADEPLVTVERADIESLKARAGANPRRRIRLCTHVSPEDRVHEMLIVHTSDAYVRPHKHLDKVESFHVIEGQGRIVIFDEEGHVEQVIPIGNYGSGRCFYYRLSSARFHTVLIDSPALVFHETTNGPFRPLETVWAPWSPPESDHAACSAYADELRRVAGEIGTKGRAEA
jgi:cupin fold WbuC family metalloprotein